MKTRLCRKLFFLLVCAWAGCVPLTEFQGNDWDADGALVGADCDDNDSELGSAYQDQDCDGVLTSED